MEAADLHQHCAHSTAATRTQTPPPASGAIQVVLGRSFLVCMPVGTETLSPNEKNTRRSAFSVGEPPATTGRRHRRGSSHFESKGPPSRSAAPRKRPGAYAPSRCVRSTASPGRLRSVLRMRSREPPRRGVRSSGARAQLNLSTILRGACVIFAHTPSGAHRERVVHETAAAATRARDRVPPPTRGC